MKGANNACLLSRALGPAIYLKQDFQQDLKDFLYLQNVNSCRKEQTQSERPGQNTFKSQNGISPSLPAPWITVLEIGISQWRTGCNSGRLWDKSLQWAHQYYTKMPLQKQREGSGQQSTGWDLHNCSLPQCSGLDSVLLHTLLLLQKGFTTWSAHTYLVKWRKRSQIWKCLWGLSVIRI